VSFRKKPGRCAEGSYSHCRIVKKCPVAVGDELEVNITDINPSGDGITRIQRHVIIVPKAKPRERVKIKITSVGEKTATGEIIK
jgi:predicted RNA-binding protein with TRAM domain